MVAYTEYPETASYGWEYRGGCYKDGGIGVYEKAVTGTDYLFDFIPIEIREDESLYGKLSSATSTASSGIGPLFKGIGIIFLVLALISGILFAVFFFKAR
jgi:hypothetical protein